MQLVPPLCIEDPLAEAPTPPFTGCGSAKRLPVRWEPCQGPLEGGCASQGRPHFQALHRSAPRQCFVLFSWRRPLRPCGRALSPSSPALILDPPSCAQLEFGASISQPPSVPSLIPAQLLFAQPQASAPLALWPPLPSY